MVALRIQQVWIQDPGAGEDGTVVDGHLRLKAASKLGSWPGGYTTGIRVILCDEWTDAQVKAFRLMVGLFSLSERAFLSLRARA